MKIAQPLTGPLALAFWLTAMALAAPAQAQADRVYRWVDDNGVTHFSAHPPPGRESTLVRGRTGTPAAPLRSPATPATPAAPARPAEQQAAPLTPRVEAVESNLDPERCATARQNLANLQSMARIRVPDGSGGYRFLDDDERQSRALEAQTVIDESC